MTDTKNHADAAPQGRAWSSFTDNTSLLRLWHQGDTSARDELMRRLSIVAHRRLRNRVPLADAPDVAQELLIRLTTSLLDFRFECSLQSFYYVIESRCIIDYLRRTYHTPKDFDPETLTLTDHGALTATRKLSLDEHLSRLEVALRSELTIREFQIVSLVLLQGMPAVEVARLLDVTPSTVRTTVRRVRVRLKLLFGEHYMQIARSEDLALEQLDLDLARLGRAIDMEGDHSCRSAG